MNADDDLTYRIRRSDRAVARAGERRRPRRRRGRAAAPQPRERRARRRRRAAPVDRAAPARGRRRPGDAGRTRLDASLPRHGARARARAGAHARAPRGRHAARPGRPRARARRDRALVSPGRGARRSRPRLDAAAQALGTTLYEAVDPRPAHALGLVLGARRDELQLAAAAGARAGARLRRLARGLSPARDGPFAQVLGPRPQPLPGVRGAPALAAAPGVYIGASSASTEGRGPVIGAVAVLAAIVLVALVLVLAGGGGYTVHADFVSASQLVKGNQVKVAGSAVGSVGEIVLTDAGRARVTLNIDAEGYHPLRRGTRAIIRQTSLSGVANRYVDLQLGARRRRRHRRRRHAAHREHRGGGRPRPDLRHVRSRGAQGRAEERQVSARLPGRQRGSGQRGAALSSTRRCRRPHSCSRS